MERPPQVHVSKYFVPRWWWYIGRLWKLWDTGPGWQTQTTLGTLQWAQPGPAYGFCFLIHGDVIIYTASSTQQAQGPRYSRLCVFKPWVQMKLPSLELFSKSLGHRTTIQCTCQVWLKVEQRGLWPAKTMECLDVLCIRMRSLPRLIHG